MKIAFEGFPETQWWPALIDYFISLERNIQYCFGSFVTQVAGRIQFFIQQVLMQLCQTLSMGENDLYKQSHAQCSQHPPHLFQAQQQKGSDLRCHSQVVISCPVNVCQMIASFPQAERWIENIGSLLANKPWDLVSFSLQAPNLLLCSFCEAFHSFPSVLLKMCL